MGDSILPGAVSAQQFRPLVRSVSSSGSSRPATVNDRSSARTPSSASTGSCSGAPRRTAPRSAPARTALTTEEPNPAPPPRIQAVNLRVSGLPLFPNVPDLRSITTEAGSGVLSLPRNASSAAEAAETSSFPSTRASRARESGSSTSACATWRTRTARVPSSRAVSSALRRQVRNAPVIGGSSMPCCPSSFFFRFFQRSLLACSCRTSRQNASISRSSSGASAAPSPASLLTHTDVPRHPIDPPSEPAAFIPGAIAEPTAEPPDTSALSTLSVPTSSRSSLATWLIVASSSSTTSRSNSVVAPTLRSEVR
ncbi:hypothetical protein SHIRM173S_07477 [Streptomyces hirsutus]